MLEKLKERLQELAKFYKQIKTSTPTDAKPGAPAKEEVKVVAPPAKEEVKVVAPPAKEEVKVVAPPAKEEVKVVAPPAKEEVKVVAPVVATSISQSVGEGGKNIKADVILVQQLLNKNHGQSLTADGDCGAKTINAIKDFQAKKMGSAKPDGRIDAGGKTWAALSAGAAAPVIPPVNNTTNDTPVDLKGEYIKIAAQYGVEQAVIYTIQKVESNGKGYLADGRAKILFEGHVFWKELVAIGKDPNKLVKGNEDILYQKWVKTHYVGGAGEYDRLAKAQKIDSTAALKSASWGEFQIMGNNHKNVGYSTVEAFVEAMKVPGTNNVKAMMEYCKSNNLLRFVNGPNKNWAGFANGYNGPRYAENEYDKKLAAAYEDFKAQYPEAPTKP